MSLANAVAAFLVAWNDELPRNKLDPFVHDLTVALMLARRGPGRPASMPLLAGRIRALRAEGKSQAAIARELGCSQAAVSKVLASPTTPLLGKPPLGKSPPSRKPTPLRETEQR